MKHKILQLIANNLNAQRSFNVVQNNDEATLFVYDVIGDYFGIEAEAFARELATITAPVINLRINSPGGDVFDARAMATLLREHPAKVIAHIDGMAASAATTLALAADEVKAAKGSRFMIHNAWTMGVGNKHELSSIVTLLEKVDQDIAGDYQAKTGADLEQVTQWMDDETWFSAEEALEHGFIDEIKDVSAVDNRWNLSAYANAPDDLKPQEDYRAKLLRRVDMLDAVAA